MSIPSDKTLYLVHGDDDFLVQEASRELVNNLCPAEMQTTGLVLLDGAVDKAEVVEETIKQVIQALFTVSLFGDRTVVWLKDTVFLNPYKDPGRKADVKAAVQGLLEKMKAGNPGNILVVSGQTIDKRTALWKFFDKEGHISVHKRPEKTWDVDKNAKQQASQWFAEAKLKISSQVLDKFIQRAGAETRQLKTEIEKLSLFAGEGGDVTRPMIDDLVTSAREAILWDFTDAIGMADLPGALRHVRMLLGQRENPVMLIIQMTSRVRELLLFRECMDRGWLRGTHWDSGAEASRHLDRLNPDPRKIHHFRIKNLVAQAGNYRLNSLRKARDFLVLTHEKMVSNSLPQELLLELAIIRTISAKKR